MGFQKNNSEQNTPHSRRLAEARHRQLELAIEGQIEESAHYARIAQELRGLSDLQEDAPGGRMLSA